MRVVRGTIAVPQQMYERTATGLAPEIVHFNRDDWSEEDDKDFIIMP